jgi:hypothetical protein
MHLKKPSFRRTDFSPSWTHKSDSLPNLGVNTYLVRLLALLAVCPVQPHCFLFIDVRVPHVRPPHAKRTRAPRPCRSTIRPPVRASPCSCAAWLPCATPRASHACSTTSRSSNRTGSSSPMPACSYASRSHRSATLICILATVLLAPARCPTPFMSLPVPAPHRGTCMCSVLPVRISCLRVLVVWPQCSPSDTPMCFSIESDQLPCMHARATVIISSLQFTSSPLH